MEKMKAILFVIAAMGCVAVSGGPNLYGSESKVAVVKNGEVFKVIYHGPVEATVKVTILDADQQPIFTEKIISRGKFMRPYNLSQLPKGDYKIRVEDQFGEPFEQLCSTDIKADAKMNEEQVADLDEEGSNAYKEEWNAHVVKIKGVENKFMVAIPHQADDEVAINIYDQDEQLVFSEKQKLNTDFAKVYVLKNLEGGTIKVVNETSKKVKRYRAD